MLKHRPVVRIFIFGSLISSVLLAGCEDSVVEALKIPVATLAAPVFTAPSTELSSSGSVTLALSLSQAISTTLSSVTGTSAAPPNGFHVVTSGTASCTSIATSGTSITGATITVSGCTGDGSITINATADIATSETNRGNAASDSQTIVVNNTAPTATVAAALYSAGNPTDEFATVTLTATYTDAVSTTIVTGSGARTNGVTPGLTFTTVAGAANCAVEITSASETAVEVELTDCQGAGTIDMKVNASTATGASGLLNAISNASQVVIFN